MQCMLTFFPPSSFYSLCECCIVDNTFIYTQSNDFIARFACLRILIARPVYRAGFSDSTSSLHSTMSIVKVDRWTDQPTDRQADKTHTFLTWRVAANRPVNCRGIFHTQFQKKKTFKKKIAFLEGWKKKKLVPLPGTRPAMNKKVKCRR